LVFWFVFGLFVGLISFCMEVEMRIMMLFDFLETSEFMH
jgi:hypothetical protein